MIWDCKRERSGRFDARASNWQCASPDNASFSVPPEQVKECAEGLSLIEEGRGKAGTEIRYRSKSGTRSWARAADLPLAHLHSIAPPPTTAHVAMKRLSKQIWTVLSSRPIRATMRLW
jgi:hypothetical protein